MGRVVNAVAARRIECLRASSSTSLPIRQFSDLSRSSIARNNNVFNPSGVGMRGVCRPQVRWFATENASPGDKNGDGKSKSKLKEKKPKDPGDKKGVDDETAEKLAQAARMQQRMWDNLVPDANMGLSHPMVPIMICAVLFIQVFYLSQFGKAPIDENQMKADRLKEREKMREKEKVNLKVGAVPGELVQPGGEVSFGNAKELQPPDLNVPDQQHSVHLAKESKKI